jgi:hypothetical protein
LWSPSAALLIAVVGSNKEPWISCFDSGEGLARFASKPRGDSFTLLARTSGGGGSDAGMCALLDSSLLAGVEGESVSSFSRSGGPTGERFLLLEPEVEILTHDVEDSELFSKDLEAFLFTVPEDSSEGSSRFRGSAGPGGAILFLELRVSGITLSHDPSESMD